MICSRTCPWRLHKRNTLLSEARRGSADAMYDFADCPAKQGPRTSPCVRSAAPRAQSSMLPPACSTRACTRSFSRFRNGAGPNDWHPSPSQPRVSTSRAKRFYAPRTPRQCMKVHTASSRFTTNTPPFYRSRGKLMTHILRAAEWYSFRCKTVYFHGKPSNFATTPQGTPWS